MKFVGTSSSLPLSKFIRWGTGSRSSHFLMVFDEKLVLHSNLYGVGLAWWFSVLRHNRIEWEIDLPLPLEKEEEVYASVLNEHDDYGWDFKAFAYWVYVGLRNKFLGTPLPSQNAWGSKKCLLCTGLYSKLPKWLVGDVDESQIEMTTPDELGVIIKNRVLKIQEELCR